AISADRTSFTVDTLIMPQQDGTARQDRVIEIAVGAASPVSLLAEDWAQELAEAYETLKTVPAVVLSAENFLSSLPTDGAGLLLSSVLTGHGLPNVFLKQFPSADGSLKAVYQAVLEAPIDLRSMQQKPRKTNPATIRTVHCFSH